MPTRSISPIDRVEVEYDITLIDPDGIDISADVTELSFADLRPNVKPDAETVWMTFPVVDRVVTVTYTGPEAADQTSSLLVPFGGIDSWAKEVDGDLVKAVKVERVSLTR